MSLFFTKPREESRIVDGAPFNVGPGREWSAQTQLALVALYSAVSQIADSFASTPLHAYRYAEDDTRKRAKTPALFVQPASSGTVYDWKHQAITSCLLRGNAYGYHTGFDSMGWPRSTEWLHPDHVQVDETGPRPIYRYKGQELERHRVLHIPAFVQPGSIVGLSPIQNFRTVIDGGLQAQDKQREWMRNGATPSHVLRNTEQTIDAAEAEAVSDRYSAKVRTGRPLTVGKDWEISPLGVSEADAKFIESTKATATQIAAIYKLQPEDVGGETGSSLTYNTVEMGDIRYQNRALRPWVTRFEAAFDTVTPRPIHMRFNLDAQVRTDLRTRWQVHQTALASGAKTINEVRALEDLPPVTWGDEPYPFTQPKQEGTDESGS